MKARDLLLKIRSKLRDLNEEILNHPYVIDAERGVLSIDRVIEFVLQQYYIVSHDIRSIALMLSRATNTREVLFFKKLLDGDINGLKNLLRMAEELGLDENAMAKSKPNPGAVAYTHYLSWLALYANPGEQAFAMIVNLPVWGRNCGRLAKAFKEKYGLKNLEFLKAFASIPKEFEEEALWVAEPYIERSGEAMERISLLIQAYEKMFWDYVYHG